MNHKHKLESVRKKRGHVRIPKDDFKDFQVNRIEQMDLGMTDIRRDTDRDQYLGFCEWCGWIPITKEEYANVLF